MRYDDSLDAGVTFTIAKAIDATIGLHVTADEERESLNLVLHGESVP